MRVLLVERATFPKDTLNGHGILATGARSLQRWGLLDRVLESGCYPFRKHTYDFESLAFTGHVAWPDGSPVTELAPRRYILDSLLAESAAIGGAELRQGFAVEDLIWEGDSVVGVRGRTRSGRRVEERARLVIGADGFRSAVAAEVKATRYETLPPATCFYYSHWSGIGTDALELYARPGRYVVVMPSNDGLTCVGVGWPIGAFSRIRGDVEAHFMDIVDQLPGLADRLRAGRRAEPFRGTADTPMFLRTPYGAGWALIGDAGCRVDPITGQGITDAFRDAEFLTEAVLAGLGGTQPMAASLAGYQKRRDAAVLPMFRYTAQRARLQPPGPDAQRLLAALAGNQAEADRFAGLTAGTTAIDEFFAPDNISRIVGRSPVRAA